jgi:hypothetical protein
MHVSTKYARSRQGVSMRSKALSAAMKRKEEYLGARVPKELKEKVIERAAGLGIPVSILIRKVLEGAFSESALDEKSLDISTHVDPSQESSGGIAANKFPTVLGWENIRLNRETMCAGCGKKIERGTCVTLGLSVQGEEHIILCDICSESL